VTFLLDRAGVTGPDGASHHGVFDLTFLRMIPNMVLGAPADAADLCGMIETAATHPGPMAIRYPKAAATSIPSIPVAPIPVGEWAELSSGSDVLFLANGRYVETVQKVASRLEQDGVSVGVVNARWVKPLDGRLFDWVDSAKVVVTVEDNVLAGGFGAAVLEALAGTGLAGKVHTIGIPDAFLPFGSADDVISSIGLDVDSLTSRVQLILEH
jgi:1-deoxy-D-xylulose-5-phosphate synthase